MAAIWGGTAAPTGVAAECGGLFQDPCPAAPDPDVGVGGNPSTDASGGLVVPASANRYGLRALAAPAAGKPLYPRAYGLLPFGLVDNSLEDGGASPEEVASIHEALGATLVRASLYWPGVERAAGTWDWRRNDEIYRAFIRHGVRPMWLVVQTPRYAVSLVDAGNCDGNYCPAEPDSAHEAALAELGYRLARRYPLSAGFELRNEPNLPFGSPRIPALDYARRLRLFHDGVERARPAMRVYGGALGIVGPEDYLDQLLRARAGSAMDGLTFHPYDETPGYTQFRLSFARITAPLAAAGNAGMRLFPDELGVSTTNPERTVTQADQSARLRRQYDDLDRRSRDLPGVGHVDAVTMFTTVDKPVSGQDAGYGWFLRPRDPAGRLRPKRVFCDMGREFAAARRAYRLAEGRRRELARRRRAAKRHRKVRKRAIRPVPDRFEATRAAELRAFCGSGG